MNEDVFNMSLRKFLKQVGVTSQREIEHAVRAAIAEGRLNGNAPVKAVMQLTLPSAGLSVAIDGAIELE